MKDLRNVEAPVSRKYRNQVMKAAREELRANRIRAGIEKESKPSWVWWAPAITASLAALMIVFGGEVFSPEKTQEDPLAGVATVEEMEVIENIDILEEAPQ